MRSYRLNRLFDPRSGRCLDVAVDHGLFGEPAFLPGIEDMRAVVDTLVAAGPDAIQLTVGQADLLQSRPGKAKPALVLRTDVANVYGSELPERLYSRMLEDAVLQAVRLDAACVVVNLFDIPGQPALREACIANVLRLRSSCDELAMPLMVEPLVMKAGGAGGYTVDGGVDRVVALVRQAVELGADVIKADPTDDLDEYPRVLETAAPAPVLVRGGGRVPDEEILRRTEAVMERGAAGIVYGRNVIQHENPAGMTRALMAVVHDGASADEAFSLLAARA